MTLGHLLLAGTMFTIGGLIAAGVVIEVIQHDAVKAGAAFYDCRPDTGKCSFTWISVKP